MTAYYIASPLEITDPEAMKEYGAGSRGVLESFDGRYLASHSPTQVLAGPWEPESMVVIEFPSVERCMEWYESEDYKPWRELRERSSKASIVVTGK